MKRWIAVVAVLGLVAGCVGRVALYSPRLPPSEDHRAAVSNADCLECHDVTARANHATTDDCRNCHTICEGC
ncbi:MAG: hypothetical protein P1P84_15665 [Deferrisomatales bacterium]|nr:hypothetical protein [Deferrisomatales bacterium]